jgi:CRISPR-associated endonuclease Csn1
VIHDGKPSLTKEGRLSFDKIRNILGLPEEARFNLETDKREYLLGDLTAAKLSQKHLFGKSWREFPLERQIEIVNKLLDTEDEMELIAWLIVNTGIAEPTAKEVVSAFAGLPDGHARLGVRAITKLVPRMEAGATKTEAEEAEYPGQNRPTGELSPDGYLPYYGQWLPDDVVGSGDPNDIDEKRWGRFPNPTVHIGLGQIGRIVNALIEEHGPPAEIAVEMTRDFKLSPKLLDKLNKEQTENQQNNDRRAEAIRKLGQKVNRDNLLRMRLWEELNPDDAVDRCCPYTGDRISCERLLSAEVDIDHLIPFSDSWDDSASNKVVCMRYANRAKGDRTPFGAFGTNPRIDGHQYDWNAISLRADNLPNNKRWRFKPDAAQRFEKMGGFLARQLNETGWLARVAKKYLSAVTSPNKIDVLPGKLTAMIRAKWGLNDLLPDHNFSDAKNRKDHRHHAIDALVVALTNRPLLHRMSSANDDQERERIIIPKPWETLREDLGVKLKAMTVSHKADHGKQGRLFKDTAYGAVRKPEQERDANKKYLARISSISEAATKKTKKIAPADNLVYRKPFLSLAPGEIVRIRDIRLRELVRKHVESKKPASALELKAALQSFTESADVTGLSAGIRHVRLVDIKEPTYMIPIRRKSGEIYKSYFGGENAFVEIFETLDGWWDGEAVSVFSVNQEKGPTMEWPEKSPGAKLVMRVFKGDLIALDFNGQRTVMVVRQLDASASRFKLAAHNEAGQLQDRHEKKKNEYKGDPFRWLMASYSSLKAMKAELVRVDELGRPWRVKPQRPQPPV